MYIQQLYTNCLAQAAYYVESEGEALIIDPLREPQPYLDLARQRNAKIKYVFETHFHADFVSGHLEISKLTGAVIVYGPNAKPDYLALIAIDNEEFTLGKIKIKVLHTPGHTIESSSFLLFDENKVAKAVFTGDTLFIGDVGRPDLLSGNLSKEELAGMLYDSLQKKIKVLADDIIVYPGHGAGSACGKNIGKETVSTIGEQKKQNYALLSSNKQQFIRTLTEGLPIPPAYFFKDASINVKGYDSYETLMNREFKALTVKEFENEIDNKALILDARSADDFGNGYITGSINIGLNGDFAVWAGTLIEFNTPIILIAESGKEKECIVRLARIGYDNVKGYLNNGIEEWKKSGKELDKIRSIEYDEIDRYRLDPHFTIIDVRKPEEHSKTKIRKSIIMPLNTINKGLDTLDDDKQYLVYCAGGYRSMVAISMLKKHGIKHVLNLKGGINAYAMMLD